MSLNELLSTMSKTKNALTFMFAEGLLDYICNKCDFKLAVVFGTYIKE